MELGLENKKVLITGASKGLGLAIAKAFLSEKAVVTICSRMPNIVGKDKQLLSVSGPCLYKCAVDAKNKDSVAQCVKTAAKQMKGLDILINNVGGAEKFASFFDLTNRDWISTYQLNVMSMVYFSRDAYPFLKKSDCPRIVNISSLTGLQPGTFNPHYSTCKAATINLSKYLANIFSRDNILVNCVVPGTFESDSWDRNIQRLAQEKGISIDIAEKEEVELACQSIPLKRIGKADEIVPIILLLASPASSWETGSCIIIDGGKMRSVC